MDILVTSGHGLNFGQRGFGLGRVVGGIGALYDCGLRIG